MGSKHSNNSYPEYASTTTTHTKRRFRTPFTFLTKSSVIGTDANNNFLVSPQCSIDDVDSSTTSPVIPYTPTAPSIRQKKYRKMPFQFIKSKLNKLFSSRNDGGNTTACSLQKEDDYFDISTIMRNETFDKAFDVNNNPLLRNSSGNKLNQDELRNNNVFARPITPEILATNQNVHYEVPSVTVLQMQRSSGTLSSSGTNSNSASPLEGDSSGTSGTSESELLRESLLIANWGPTATPQSTGNNDGKGKTRNIPPGCKVDHFAKYEKEEHHHHEHDHPKSKPEQKEKDHSPPKAEKKDRSARTMHFGGTGCCDKRSVPPPAYLDYGSSPIGGGGSYGGRRSRTGNPILDMLKNVDVIEELKYHVPDGEIGGCDDSEEHDEDFDYFYQCNGCGEMEPCKSPKDRKEKTGGKPVTYSRRQRFNFAGSGRGGMDDEDGDDGPPFKWPASKSCSCPCCIAGLRRNPDCGCKCCQEKGKARVVNSFDEIPVGKNPEPKSHHNQTSSTAISLSDISTGGHIGHKHKEHKDEIPCEKLLPCESGVYFYDADEKVFIRQVPRTPSPVIIEQRRPPPRAQRQEQEQEDFCCPNTCCPDMADIIQCLPPRRRQPSPCRNVCKPQPIVMPPIYGGCNDMKGVLANLEMNLRAGQMFCGGEQQPIEVNNFEKMESTNSDIVNNNTESSLPKSKSSSKVKSSYTKQDSKISKKISSSFSSTGSKSKSNSSPVENPFLTKQSLAIKKKDGSSDSGLPSLNSSSSKSNSM